VSLKAVGWLLAAGIVLWLFILGALVPWISSRLAEVMDGLPL
jgi:hypothetical protein